MIPYSVGIDGWDLIQLGSACHGHSDIFIEVCSFSLGQNRILKGEAVAFKNYTSRIPTFAFNVLHSPSVFDSRRPEVFSFSVMPLFCSPAMDLDSSQGA